MELEDMNYCPVCAEPIDYCPGHGSIADPEGFKILMNHASGYHDRCHPVAITLGVCDDEPY